jgi:hypothetical protein
VEPVGYRNQLISWATTTRQFQSSAACADGMAEMSPVAANAATARAIVIRFVEILMSPLHSRRRGRAPSPDLCSTVKYSGRPIRHSPWRRFCDLRRTRRPRNERCEPGCELHASLLVHSLSGGEVLSQGERSSTLCAPGNMPDAQRLAIPLADHLPRTPDHAVPVHQMR